jgi:predicted PurR-regulated permease PerM
VVAVHTPLNRARAEPRLNRAYQKGASGLPEQASPGKPGARLNWREFVHRVWLAVLVVAAVGSAILLLCLAYKVALVFFASVLLGIFFRTLSDWVSRWTRLGSGWSLAIVIVALLALCGLLGWLLATPISQEVDQLTQELPKAVARLQAQLEQFSWGRAIVARWRQPSGLFAQAGSLLSKASDLFSITVEGVVYVWVILFCGFYLATQPQFYVEGFLRLLPQQKRPRGRVVLHAIGEELRHWLFGQIISMAIIGFLTWLGLHFLGIPLSAALGLLAGVLDFIPVVGPWVAGIISCVLALLRSPMHAVYVASLFVTLHLFEGHVLIPQVQKHATRLPPVLTVLAMVLFSQLFGFLGLFLATPLLALVMMVTKALYVEDVLKQRA